MWRSPTKASLPILALFALLAVVSSAHCRAQERDDLDMDQPLEAEENDPTSELEAITDLLLDERFTEARARAEKLLARDDLYDAERSRAGQLLEKSNAKLGRSAERPKIEIKRSEDAEKPVPKGPPSASPKAVKEPEVKEKAKSQTAGDAAPAKGASFLARLAVVGSGFREGATGSLQISQQGISFHGKNGSGSWRIAWRNLAEARLDDGFWDSPHPLLFQERGGPKRYVSRIDSEGRYLTAKPVLDVLSRFRGRAPRSPVKSQKEEGKDDLAEDEP